MNKYLEMSEYIDCDNPKNISLAKAISEESSPKEEITKNYFQWVPI